MTRGQERLLLRVLDRIVDVLERGCDADERYYVEKLRRLFDHLERRRGIAGGDLRAWRDRAHRAEREREEADQRAAVAKENSDHWYRKFKEATTPGTAERVAKNKGGGA